MYIGSDLGMIGEKNVISREEKMTKDLNIRYVNVKAGKFHRFVTIDLVRQFVRMIIGFFQSLKLLSGEKPDLVFSTGGYVAVMVVLAAKFLQIPIIIHDQTISIGLATKITSKFADKVLVSYPEAKKFFPREKVILTGNPLRKSIFNSNIELAKNTPAMTKQKLKQMFLLSKKYPILLMVGGGNGSHLLNIALLKVAKTLLKRYQLIVQTGSNQIFQDYQKFENLITRLNQDFKKRIFVTKFIYDELGPILAHTYLVAVSYTHLTLPTICCV